MILLFHLVAVLEACLGDILDPDRSFDVLGSGRLSRRVPQMAQITRYRACQASMATFPSLASTPATLLVFILCRINEETPF